MVQGLAQDARQIKENMVLMGIAGRRVFAVSAPYGIDVKNLPADIAEKTKDVPEIERRKIATLHQAVGHIREKTGAGQVKAITLSEGSIVFAGTAKAQPDWFSDAILVEPAGMTNPDEPDQPPAEGTIGKIVESAESLYGAGKLAVGGVKDTILQDARIKKAEIEKKYKIDLSSRLVALQRKLGILNPKDFDPKFARENVAISKENAAKSTAKDRDRIIGAIPIIAGYRIGDTLKNLREQNGLQIVVVEGVNDQFFNVKQMRQSSRADMMDGSLVVKGGHGQMTIRPKPYTAAFDNVLDSLETKRKKRPAAK